MQRYTVHTSTGAFVGDHRKKADAITEARQVPGGGATVTDRNLKRIVFTSRWESMEPESDVPVKPADPEHGTLPGPGFKSWRPEVIADGSGQWAGNALRFTTKEEAEANVRDLFMRWMLVRDTRVVESTDEVNYLWDVERGLVPCVPFKKEG